jgi:hypothetical protein
MAKKKKKKIKKVSKKKLKKIKGGINLGEEFGNRLNVNTHGFTVAINEDGNIGTQGTTVMAGLFFKI